MCPIKKSDHMRSMFPKDLHFLLNTELAVRIVRSKN
jgi:hypothetical protein